VITANNNNRLNRDVYSEFVRYGCIRVQQLYDYSIESLNLSYLSIT